MAEESHRQRIFGTTRVWLFFVAWNRHRALVYQFVRNWAGVQARQ